MPELKTNSDDDHDGRVIPVPETKTDGEDDHGAILVSSGYRDCNYPLGNVVSPWTLRSTCQVTSDHQARNAGPQLTDTYPQDTRSKQGEMMRVGGATSAGSENLIHDKGKRVMGESSGAAAAWKVSAKAIGDVAATSNVVEFEKAGVENFKIKKTQVAAFEKAACEEVDTSHVKGGRPINRVGLSICTPIQHKQPLGLILQNSNGGLDSNCKVYSRQRRYQKKTHMGQPSPIDETEIGLCSFHTQHLQDVVLDGSAANNYNDSTTKKASHNEGTEEIVELQHCQEATNMWNRAKQLGATGGDDQQIIIEKIKEMEERDKKEPERLGNSSGYP